MDKHTYCIILSLTFVGPFLLIQGKLICPICQLHDWYHLGYFLDSMPSYFLINAFLGLCMLFVVVACSFEPWWSWDANSHLRMKTKELIRNSIKKVWLLDFRHYCREIGQDLSFFFFFSDHHVLISMDFILLAQFLLRNLAAGVLRDRWWKMSERLTV